MVGPSNYSVVTAGRSANFAAGTARNLTNGGVSWALNQVVNAQAIRLPNGNTALRIDGAIYTPVGSEKFVPGTMRQLQVTALDPVIKLTVIKDAGGMESATGSLRIVPASTHINLSTSQWASQISNHPNRFATLLGMFHRPPDSVSQQLSPQVLASMQQIGSWLPVVSDLRHSGRLRGLFEEFSKVSAALPGKLESASSSRLLEMVGSLRIALQNQLRSITESNSLAVSMRPYQGDLGSQKAVASTLLLLLDSALPQYAGLQRRPQAPWLPWGFSFPYIERDRAQVLSVQARRRKLGKPSSRESEYWRISCACQFQFLGVVIIQIGLSGNQCKVQFRIENLELLPARSMQQQKLSSMLSAENITLLELGCAPLTESELAERKEWQSAEPQAAIEFDVATDATPLSDDVTDRLNNAALNDTLPELREFEMTGNKLLQSEVNSLPDSAYQVLASIFVLLLSITEELE